LPDDLYARLAAAAGGEGAALALSADGPQPLCSIWPVTALDAVNAALAEGRHPPTWRVLESIGARRLQVMDEDAFANLNTRADLQAIEARFTSGKSRR
jgi:molybdopterin-guanine dinucleotide biosynthesis protein A